LQVAASAVFVIMVLVPAIFISQRRSSVYWMPFSIELMVVPLPEGQLTSGMMTVLGGMLPADVVVLLLPEGEVVVEFVKEPLGAAGALASAMALLTVLFMLGM
jgi:hypothetical protein